MHKLMYFAFFVSKSIPNKLCNNNNNDIIIYIFININNINKK